MFILMIKFTLYEPTEVYRGQAGAVAYLDSGGSIVLFPR